MHKYYLYEPVHIYIQSLINMMKDNNWIITTKRVRVNYHYFVVMGDGEFPSMAAAIVFLYY